MPPATGTIQTTKNVVDKKKTVNRVTLFSHLVIYTRQVDRLQDALFVIYSSIEQILIDSFFYHISEDQKHFIQP